MYVMQLEPIIPSPQASEYYKINTKNQEPASPVSPVLFFV